MKKRYRKKIYDIKIITDIFFVMLGMAVMFFFMFISAIIISRLGLMYKTEVILAELSLCAGCFASGFCYALFKRKKGIYNGFINSLRIYLLIFISGLVLTDSIELSLIPLRFAGAAFSGMAGGFYGVNSKLKKPA